MKLAKRRDSAVRFRNSLVQIIKVDPLACKVRSKTGKETRFRCPDPDPMVQIINVDPLACKVRA